LPIGFGIYLLRRLLTLRPGVAGALIGTASGTLPALAMQVACMYSPDHILRFHVAPIVVPTTIGIIAAIVFLRARSPAGDARFGQ